MTASSNRQSLSHAVVVEQGVTDEPPERSGLSVLLHASTHRAIGGPRTEYEDRVGGVQGEVFGPFSAHELNRRRDDHVVAAQVMIRVADIDVDAKRAQGAVEEH